MEQEFEIKGGTLTKYVGKGGIVAVPNGIATIGRSAFYNCRTVIEVNLPDTVTDIKNNAFQGCCNMLRINVPNGVTSIGGCAFESCESLKQIELPQGIASIPNGTFATCTRLKEITIPNGVTSIGKDAFHNCIRLKNIKLPVTLESIGDKAFAYCNSLTDLRLPKSVATLGRNVFEGDNGLTVRCEAFSAGWQNNWAKGVFAVIWNCNASNRDTKGREHVEIDGFKYALCGSNAIVSGYVNDPSVALGIPSHVSYGGKEYTVSGIVGSAYACCSNLTSVFIPNTVSFIGDSAFFDCNAATLLCEAANIPPDWNKNFNYSGCPVIMDCRNNNKANDGVEYAVINGVRYAIKDGKARTVRQSADMRELAVPSSVTYNGEQYQVERVGNWSCMLNDGLTSVSIAEGVKSVGGQAFCVCRDLTHVELPQSLESLDYSVFESCIHLKELDIPDNVTRIGSDAFRKCVALERVTLPSKLENIGERAFAMCSALRRIVIPESVAAVGKGAFSDCARTLVIYCQARSKPDGWADDWCGDCEVVWGYEGKNR